MNILVAIDVHHFDRRLAREVGRLAANTWANITLLGTLSGTRPKSLGKFQQNLLNYRKTILDSFPAESSGPYNGKNINTWERAADGSVTAKTCTGQKRLELLLTKGVLDRELVKVGQRQAIDLLVFGEAMHIDSLLYTAATEAAYSVLVVKGAGDPGQIVCCLDHEHVTHKSLEMINQLVTLYNADLKIVGFANSGEERAWIESRLEQLLNYYSNLQLTPWLEVVDGSIMPQFIFQEAKKNMVAIWVEKSSFFTRLFPQEKLTELIIGSHTSVLLLR